MNDPNNPTWMSQHIFLMVWRTIIAIPVYIILFIIIGYILLFVRTHNLIIGNYGVFVEPFNPDNAGGLGEMGRFSANLGYLMLGFGLIVGLM